MVMTSLLTQRPCFTRRRSRVRVSPRVHFFFFTPPMPLRRPTALFGRLCKKNFIKSCFEPGLPFAGLQTPAKCKGRGAGFNEQKKIGDNIDLCIFAYRIELMTSRMLSRRLQFRCFCTDLPTELYPQVWFHSNRFKF